MGVDVAGAGKILWRTPLKTGAKRHACTPVIGPDSVVVASSSIGTQKVRKSVKTGLDVAAQKAWANSNRARPTSELRPCSGTSSSPSGSGDRMRTLNASTLRHRQPGLGPARLRRLRFAHHGERQDPDSELELGELILIKADPTEVSRELGRTQLCAKTWASPGLRGTGRSM